MKRFSKAAFLFFLSISLASCTFVRTLVFNFAGIRDYRHFQSHEIKNADQPFVFAASSPEWKQANPFRLKVSDQKRQLLDDFLPQTPTVAFLIIRHDTILYERYFDKYEQSSILPSFSIAKSVVSALTGCAISDGVIRSVEDSMTQYLTELQGKGLGSIRIRHLLQMTSGLHSNEGYMNPFSDVAKLYYTRNLEKLVSHVRSEDPPGIAFEYRSVNSQLLGMIIERATGQTLSAYLQEKIWKHIGTENPASWSVDSKKSGMEKAFCCVNATARDFARFGRLYLNKGNWNGKQILPESWVATSTSISLKEGASRNYQYNWWIPSSKGDFCAEGILGQYIYVNPASGHIVVRLGKSEGKVNWMRIFREIAGYTEVEMKNE